MREIFDLAEFEEAVKGPVVVKFFRPWCRPCTGLGEFMEHFETPVECVSVNAENVAITARAQVEKSPTLVFYSKGNEILRLEGFKGPSSTREFFETVSNLLTFVV